MKYIGAHVSVAGGVANAPINAHSIGAKAFALFTRNPNRWVAKPLDSKDIDSFKRNCDTYGYTPDHILPHDSYLINLGAPEGENYSKSLIAFEDEMVRCGMLGLTMLNFHPGSHLNVMTGEECLTRIATSINRILDRTSGVKAVIENTAGQGSNLGYTLEQIGFIVDKTYDKSRIGVCIDTCHAFAAGYDLSNAQSYNRFWQDFDEIIGLDYLCGMHLNDSKKGLGSKVDRHHSIGKGELGADAFRLIMNDPRLDNIPIILETPDDSIWAEEIASLYALITK